jgi:hypothetical protein
VVPEILVLEPQNFRFLNVLVVLLSQSLELPVGFILCGFQVILEQKLVQTKKIVLISLAVVLLKPNNLALL